MALLLHTNEMRETKNRFPKENARFSTIVLITFLFEVSNCGEFWKITILKFKVGQPSITHLIKLVETCLCFHYAKAFFHISKFIYIYIYIHICTYIYIYKYLFIGIHICVNARM